MKGRRRIHRERFFKWWQNNKREDKQPLLILSVCYHCGRKQFFCLLCCTCSVSTCVLRGRGALMRQDYENQSPSPSQKAVAWLSAYRQVLIRLTLCDTGRVWYTTKDRAWPGHIVTGRTATRGTDRLCPCMCMHFATCDAPLEWWGGKSANAAVCWLSGWPGMGHVGIPSLSNKITVTQQLTLE